MDNYSLIDYFFLFVVWLSLSEFAIQVVISELSYWIKDKIALTQPYNKKLETLSLIPFWRKLLGKWFWVLSPLSFLILIGFNIHKFFASLLNCPYCSCFWMSVITNHFYFNMPVLESFLLAPVALVMVAILNKLHI